MFKVYTYQQKNMDLGTVSVILITIIIAVICGLIFRYATKETTFEEIYGHNARRLLNDEKLKTKSKNTKSKKTVKNGEKEKPNTEFVLKKLESTALNENDKLNVQNEINSVPEQKILKNKKNKNSFDDTSNKTKKKDNFKFTNESSDSSLEKVETEMVLQYENIEMKKKSVLKKPTLTNITFNDVINHLKTLDNLESEYVLALQRFNETNNDKKTILNDSIILLKKEITEKEQILKQTINDLKIAQNMMLQLQLELKTQQENYETFESTVRTKLADSIKLKEENKRLTTLLSQSAVKDAQYQLITNEIEILRKELLEKSLIENELAENKKLVETLQNKNTEMTNLFRDVIAAKNTAERNLAAAKQSCDKLNLKEQELHKAQQNLAETSSVLNIANNSVKELNKMLSDKVELVQLMKLKNDQLLTERSNLSQELESLKSNNHIVEEKLKIIMSNNEQCKKELEELKIKNNSLSNIRNKLEEEKIHNNKLEEEKTKLLQKINVLEHKVDAFDELHKKLLIEANERAKVEVLNEELQEKLKKKIEEQEKLVHLCETEQKNFEIAQKKLADFEAYYYQANADKQKLKALELKYNELEIKLKESKAVCTTNNSSTLSKKYNKGTMTIITDTTTNNTNIAFNNIPLILDKKIDKDVYNYNIYWQPYEKKTPIEVLISSNWWNWQLKKMELIDVGHVYSIKISKENKAKEFLFKFIVDGVWQCSKNYPTKFDRLGLENNYLDFIDN